MTWRRTPGAEGRSQLLRRTDGELIASAAAGDREAFGELMGRHTDRVYRFAAAALGDYGDAQDATQETFIEAYKCAARFDGRAPVGAWLLGIASNRCREWRRVRRRQGASLDAFARLSGDERGGAQHNPRPEAESADIRMDVGQALQALPAEYRLPIIMRFQQGLSYREIAEALGVSVGAAAMRLHRGRALLQASLSHLDTSTEVEDE